MNEFPLTAEDLESIAKQLRAWQRRLFRDGDFTSLSINIGDIEVLRPDDTEVIGHFVMDEGWLGFRFGQKKDAS